MAANFLTHSRRKWRRLGYYVEGTEQIIRLPGMVRRKDLFGFTDLLALSPDGDMVFLQVTSWGNVSSRLRKIQRETTGTGRWEAPMADLARRLIVGGNRVVVEGWRQARPGALWECRGREVTLEDLGD